MNTSNQRKARSYTNEFKQSAVQLALHSSSITVAAKELGVPGATLHTWVGQFKNGQLSGLPAEPASVSEEKPMDPAAIKQLKDNLINLLEETKRLNKKIAILEEERLILKKAAAYFAREQR